MGDVLLITSACKVLRVSRKASGDTRDGVVITIVVVIAAVCACQLESRSGMYAVLTVVSIMMRLIC